MVLKQIKQKGSVNRILVIGQTGAGKSSVINLLAGKKVATVDDGANGCTFKFETYQCDYNGELFELIDTVGLNEGSKGTVKPKDAMKMLIKFIKGNKRGFSCVLFVMPKGRITESFEKNHMLFYQTLLNGKTPAILFLSHCESDEPMNKWITNEENKTALAPYGFSDVVCGTAQEGGRFAQLIEPLRSALTIQIEEYNDALLYCKKALESFEKHFSADHRYIANCYCNIGVIYCKLKQYDLALSYYEKQLNIQLKTLPAYHFEFGVTYLNIGEIYEARSEFDLALSFYSKANEIFQKVSLLPTHEAVIELQQHVQSTNEKISHE
ncbi:unnamed protein product [Rotaria sordida]|uniref:G domain-containing protein n=1 Tax=Rotaria sordida TaxID=392033 RepID=A0A819HE95_9BILA|nr:unnamed protein product [Rotaria sordida]CAF3896764.1 unnamed protein product [Rotaria sordida]